MKIGEIIKNRRLELGLTLEEVGKKVGVGKSTVRKWETGLIENMRRDRIAKLAEVLDIPPSQLIGIAVEDKLTGTDELSARKKEFIQRVSEMSEAQLDRLEKILALVESTE